MKIGSINTHVLPNGLRLIHKECGGQTSCCGLVVNAGSRHEVFEQAGLAHFIEHMLFKGTAKRRPHQILNQMERVGGELNAYTTKEETFVYSLFLKKDYKRALDLVADLFFNPTFPEQEIEKERTVILDEISSYDDAPSEIIFDDFDELFYQDHALGRRILGYEKQLKTITRADLVRFHRTYYTPENMVLYSQAPISSNRVFIWAEQVLGSYVANKDVIGKPKFVPPVCHTGFRKVVKKETNQGHVVCGNGNYPLFDDRRTGMYFLNNILGGPGMNSRLNVTLREKKGLVYSVESSVSSFTDSGLFTVYFGTDPDQVDRCLDLLFKEFKTLRENPFTATQLHAARKQLYGQILLSSENKEHQTLSMGKSMLYFNRYDSMQELVQKIERFSGENLMELARDILDPGKLSVLIYK
jgi:predicted Zn-dependent peptidase